MKFEVQGGSVNLEKIALERDLDAEAGTRTWVENENSLRVFEINVNFRNRIHVPCIEKINFFWADDDGRLIFSSSKFVKEAKKFCIRDYETNESRDAALLNFLKKRNKELKDLKKRNKLGRLFRRTFLDKTCRIT